MTFLTIIVVTKVLDLHKHHIHVRKNGICVGLPIYKRRPPHSTNNNVSTIYTINYIFTSSRQLYTALNMKVVCLLLAVLGSSLAATTVELLAGDKKFSTLVSLVTKAGLVDAINSGKSNINPYTSLNIIQH